VSKKKRTGFSTAFSRTNDEKINSASAFELGIRS